MKRKGYRKTKGKLEGGGEWRQEICKKGEKSDTDERTIKERQ